MKGCSATAPPKKPNKITSKINNQNKRFSIKLYFIIKLVSLIKGKTNNAAIAKPIATTPANLFGIDRKIA